MLRWLFMLICCSLMGKSTHAQLTDSLKAAFATKPKLTGFFDTRNTFVDNQHIKMRGIKLGLVYDNKVIVAAGYNWLDEDIEKRIPNPVGASEDSVSSVLKLWYISGYFEYTFYDTKHWVASIPVQLGAGPAWYRARLAEEETYDLEKGLVVFYEANMTLIYKPIKYIGLGGGLGYRVALAKPQTLDTRLTAPLYTLKFNIYFGEIWADLRKSKSD